jgi:signal transduction histidine kinase
MSGMTETAKIALLAGLTAGITLAIYLTEMSERHHLIFYLGSYFVPVILAGFWFRLRGALTTSVAITVLYAPYTAMQWNGFSADDLNNLMEMLLYNAVAVILGILRDREHAGQIRSREAEHMASIGRAMACVAHDMKTPLVAIGGFSRMMRRRLPESDVNCEKLDIIIRETARLETMVKDLLDFSRPLDLQFSEEDLARLVQECGEVVAVMAGKGKVKIEIHPCPDLPLLSLDAMRMKRVLMNLVVNAVQASPEGETVSIVIRRNGASVIIDVMDRGCGIPLEKRKEIFSPFFTTKKEGTGLGLPIAKKIVEAHQGRLEILDNTERGMIFRVVMPLAGAVDLKDG